MAIASAEISSQPECWTAAAELSRDVSELLPAPGETVAVIGCGTSYNMALCYAWLREAKGLGVSDAMTASELRPGRRYDHYVFLSRSGTTSEIVEAVGKVPPGCRAVALTASPTSPLGRLVDCVDLSFAAEQSVVQTRFATSVVVLLRAHLGEDTGGLPSEARRALEMPPPEGSLEATQFTFLGSFWTVGLAHEAALKLREAAQVWTESYPAGEVRHGPISILGPSSIVWSFGVPPSGLAADIEATGARFVVSPLDPLAELVRAQRLAVQLGEAKGLDPDHPRNLSFSVVLAADALG